MSSSELEVWPYDSAGGALDDTGKRAVTWILADAIPVGYELSPMDGSQNAILSEALEFSIAGFERVTHSPPIGI